MAAVCRVPRVRCAGWETLALLALGGEACSASSAALACRAGALRLRDGGVGAGSGAAGGLRDASAASRAEDLVTLRDMSA